MHTAAARLICTVSETGGGDGATAAHTSSSSLRCRFPDGQVVPGTREPELGGNAVSCPCPPGVTSAAGAVVEAGPPCTSPPPRRPAWPARLRSKAARTCGGALLPYSIISLSYILFTLTDGALRMVVLLHAASLGFSALTLAAVFAGYEAAGVILNFGAGVLAARHGIKATLMAGLVTQLVALGMLFGWDARWAPGAPGPIVFLAAIQVLSGCAKDLTKLGGKAVTRLVTPEEKAGRLFKLVSWVTGAKNSAKGVGYLLGAALLTWNYFAALAFCCLCIGAAIPWAATALDPDLGRAPGKKGVPLRAVFTSLNARVGTLSAARFCLFASRDLWFEVALPYFLRAPVAEGGLGWSRLATGGFLAGWIVVYGQIQTHARTWPLSPLGQAPPNAAAAAAWAAILTPLPAAAAACLYAGGGTALFGPTAPRGAAVATIATLLAAFCGVFAVNSAIHSFLVVRYADGDKVATTVGAYYASNAGGRLVGTLLSGVLYTLAPGTLPARFGACLVASAVFAAAAAGVAAAIPDPDRGLRCGPCLTIGGGGGVEDGDGGEAVVVEGAAAAAKGEEVVA
jgi:MFS family permease